MQRRGLFGTSINLNESQPIATAILPNATSFEISNIPKSGTSYDGGLFDLYWFMIQGDAIVTVTGYGASY